MQTTAVQHKRGAGFSKWAVALGILSTSAMANGFNPSNPGDVEKCSTIAAFQQKMAEEVLASKSSAKNTPTYKKMAVEPSLINLFDILATYTDGVKGAISPRLGLHYSIYGLCYGLSNKVTFAAAPYVGKACNSAPVGKESDCISRFLRDAKARAKIGDEEIRLALIEIGQVLP